MTVTRGIDFLLLCSVIYVVIHVQAQQPVGYIGCFIDEGGISLDNVKLIYSNRSNMGDLCKAGCKKHVMRFAGTQGFGCYCGSNVVRKWQINETECNENCPNSSSEKCGGYSKLDKDWRISLYDTWPSESTIKPTENFTISPSTQTTQSSNLQTEQSVSAIKTTVHFIISPSTQNTKSSTLPTQTNVNLLAVYIAIPFTIILVLIALGLIIFIIRRKKQNQTKENATKQTSANTGHPTDNNVRNERDEMPLEISANVIHIGRKNANATNDRDIIPLENSANAIHIGTRIENATIDESDNNYNTIAQWRELNMHKAISVDANEYGHLNVRPTAFHDPTYSHTTGFKDSNDYNDYTYSHMNQSATQLSHVDHDTYSTCQMTGETGKHRPVMKNEDVDDTYNSLSINGKTVTVPEKKHCIQVLNEPDYEHTDVHYHRM